LAAVDTVRSLHNGELPCGVTFIVEGAEEIGSPHFADFVLNHLDDIKGQGVVWEEGNTDGQGHYRCRLGVRGLLYVEIAVETMLRDAHSGLAQLLPNAAWRLIRALMTLKGENEHILIPGFYDAVRPISEKDRAYLFDDNSERETTLLKQRFGITKYVSEYMGLSTHQAVFQPTCNIAGLISGYQGPGSKTVIPSRASAKIDFRLVPDQDPQDILLKLRAHFAEQGFDDISIIPLGGMGYPYKQDADSPLIQLSLRKAEDVYGVPGKIVPLNGGTTPVYAIAHPLGNIPFICPGVGYWDNKAHAPDEHVRLSDFEKSTQHISRILNEFADLE
jgi:acetylornithine deacetylase/succinyl-diaminopimelate desuccinylase-like protein